MSRVARPARKDPIATRNPKKASVNPYPLPICPSIPAAPAAKDEGLLFLALIELPHGLIFGRNIKAKNNPGENAAHIETYRRTAVISHDLAA